MYLERNMNTLLEKALVHLLNEEQEQAEALIHKFIVQKARQVHESLRLGDDALMESFDDINSDEMFNEADLTDLEDTGAEGEGSEGGDEFGGETAEGGDEFGGEAGDEAGEAEETLDGDLNGETAEGGEEGESEEEILDRISELEDKLAELTAQFEGGEEGDLDQDDADEFGGETGDDETFGGDVESDLGAGEGDDMASGMADDMGDDEQVHESEESDEDETEEFEDITESIVSELEKVMVTMTDGKEIGAGKSFAQNDKSPALQKKPNPMTDGKPVVIKAEEHKGFERETAPSVKDMKKRKNTRATAETGTSKVSKEGDKSALINKTPGAEANTKSPAAKR